MEESRQSRRAGERQQLIPAALPMGAAKVAHGTSL